MKLSRITHFFVFDVESIGLHGEGFAAGYVLIERDGTVVREDFFHCDPERAASAGGELDAEDRTWVAENVPPLGLTSRLANPAAVRGALWDQWERAKEDFPAVHAAAECVWSVDTAFLTAAVLDDVDKRKWRGPHPLIDIATVIAMVGFDPIAVFPRLEGEDAHHPLGDARQSARLLAECLNHRSHSFGRPMGEARIWFRNIAGQLQSGDGMVIDTTGREQEWFYRTPLGHAGTFWDTEEDARRACDRVCL